MGTATANRNGTRRFQSETFRTPMGTATLDHAACLQILEKHFLPLRGQQPVVHQLGHRVVAETFHTPMGTKRKPICPIGHIGF